MANGRQGDGTEAACKRQKRSIRSAGSRPRTTRRTAGLRRSNGEDAPCSRHGFGTQALRARQQGNEHTAAGWHGHCGGAAHSHPKCGEIASPKQQKRRHAAAKSRHAGGVGSVDRRRAFAGMSQVRRQKTRANLGKAARLRMHAACAKAGGAFPIRLLLRPRLLRRDRRRSRRGTSRQSRCRRIRWHPSSRP